MSKDLEVLEIIKSIQTNNYDRRINDYTSVNEECEYEISIIEKELKALQLIKTKSKNNYNLALVADSGTYEQYCEQFKYFLDDYREKGGAFEIWEEDKFSFEEYNLLREVFIYE